jgi:mannose-1-phosphate guanylyltransferase/mannose-6-phosphate isomerase
MSYTEQVIPVILCGGSGTRLWPLSRAGLPKQFIALVGKKTLFQDAILRSQAIANSNIEIASMLVVTNEDHRFLALDQLGEIAEGSSRPCIQAQFILEPTGKNTAPALTLAAMAALDISANSGNTDPILLVTPADQTVQDLQSFVSAIQSAVAKAKEGSIVVMGIKATHAETGYGYIKQAGDSGRFGEYAVEQFVEKPTEAWAKEYLASGQYSWNSGIFVLKASVWLQALCEFRSDIYLACERAYQNKTGDRTASGAFFIRPDQEDFKQIPSESIDYAVIEKCPNSNHPIAMVPLNAGWNDLGTWDAVWQVSTADSEGNVTQGDVLLIDSKKSLAQASSRLVSIVGVEDLVVVETADAVLVANRKKSQDVKAIVSKLQQKGREEKNLHRKVNRPWGWYDSVDEGERFKVKRIQVKPGASLSLQMHHHRAEHWIVVKGVAEITNDDQVINLQENQSTYIPKGQIHRLTNPGTEPLEIIEVQTGAYLAEDDIVRFEDMYGRKEG